ncbi:dethiobiotin synthase [Conexibacter woesei]|uniref:ATP-dependent dethiobiotin synthetase BioD n=1 Tax=Conexibacter woesei (strain DSM 14684 / CCUG 47730 / CIP 108061 / JCM 11494 / NBRC 100937 / ID131577) TaxID=469383 RepID=D3F020_CONWI|nr:dethiobiotin synthase [Conexibacter woesei]ADB49996.1 dethiobiotin synthase [Conexibacter woesei DSM 14684]
MRGCFVTGTDTGVGKTVVAAAIVAALRARGDASVTAFKPVVTGTDEPPDRDWPPDHVLLARTAGTTPEAVSPFTFGPAVSPHLAAELARRPLDPRALRAAFATAAARAEIVVAEGVGGLLVPLAADYLVRDFARDAGLPLVIAARPGLGTINHTLLTIDAARAAGLTVAGVAITPWPSAPGVIEADNRATIARLGDVGVATLPALPRADVALLAAAGATLPLDRWIGAAAS